jgi:hypothetical protein
VIGVYVGERHNANERLTVGYSTRIGGDQWLARPELR